MLKETNYSMPKIVSVNITNKTNKYENIIRVSVPHLKQPIPLFILFRACVGCITDKAII